MARRLQLTYICLAIFLLVLPLVCSKDEENNGMNDMGELLQKLLKAEKERRTMSDDTNVDGSGEGHTNDDENKPVVSIEKKPGGVIENDVKVEGELTQRIIQDCENKYELIMDKDEEKAGGTCYVHKMNDIIYQRNCKGNGTGGEVDTNYKLGPKIEDSTLLPKIKGIDGCTGKSVYELIQTDVERRAVNEYEKRLAEERGCYYCYYYVTVCSWVCVQRAGWWWSDYCARYDYQCASNCQYGCF